MLLTSPYSLVCTLIWAKANDCNNQILTACYKEQLEFINIVSLKHLGT